MNNQTIKELAAELTVKITNICDTIKGRGVLYKVSAINEMIIKSYPIIAVQ